MATLLHLCIGVLLVLAGTTVPARAVVLPSGFQQTTVISGLTEPTALQFANDGRVFVAEKSGIIKVFDNLADTTPTTFADLRTNTHNFWDRGLLGLALHPSFPAQPYVYVLYTLDAAIGGTPPRWGSFGGTSDPCPNPPGDTGDGCVVAGRVSRLTASGNVMVGTEQVFIENYCQQYPSHSIGTIGFGGDGALYVSGGDGASFTFVDYGQRGFPSRNPCGDPPGGVGATLSPPTAQGGALRSQDLLSGTDPVGYDGTVLRLNPLTGAPMPDNPLVGGSNVTDDPIIAYGLRNPFRMAPRPGTAELWIGDVGWNDWEELNRIAATGDLAIENFGWPCFEGIGRHPGYEGAGLDLCDDLYGSPGTVTDPYYAYKHSERVVEGEPCATGSSSVTAVAFYGTGAYPRRYEGALFFGDYSRSCIWAMPLGPDGEPDASARFTFASAAPNPVDLKVGPGGDLYYVDIGGRINRISYVAGTEPPAAVIEANRTDGPTPLTVQFDGSGSSDPDPADTLAYSWDLDGNGTFGDSTAVSPTRTYTNPGSYMVKLRVTDPHGATAVDTVVITAGNTRPTASIGTPTGSTTWRAGTVIGVSGSATDPQQGTLPGSALTWTLVLHHCPANCHAHTVQSFTGASGTFTAPEHEYPTHLEIRLTATDAGGLKDTTSVFLFPETVDLTLASDPPGLVLTAGPDGQTTPFVRTEIIGSSISLGAPSPQTLNGDVYTFVAWSDGGARSHEITAPATNTSYVALFECGGCGRTPTPTPVRTATPGGAVTPTGTPAAPATPTLVPTPTGTVTPTPAPTSAPGGCTDASDPQLVHTPPIDVRIGLDHGFDQSTGALNIRQRVKNTAARSLCRVKLCLGVEGNGNGFYEVQLRSDNGSIEPGSTLYGTSGAVPYNALIGGNQIVDTAGGSCGTAGNGQVVTFALTSPASVPAASFWVVVREVPNGACTGSGAPYACCSGPGTGACELTFGPTLGAAATSTGYPSGCTTDCTTFNLYKSASVLARDMYFVLGTQ